MTDFDPVATLRVLVEHRVEFVVVGGIAARLRGAPVLTQDVDITPQKDHENLERLADALKVLNARLRNAREPEGIPFPFDPQLFAASSTWTLTTNTGDLDLVMSPAGTDGYDDLVRDSGRLTIALSPPLEVRVASLVDVIRSKQAAGRAKDLAMLPLLREALNELES